MHTSTSDLLFIVHLVFKLCLVVLILHYGNKVPAESFPSNPEGSNMGTDA